MNEELKKELIELEKQIISEAHLGGENGASLGSIYKWGPERKEKIRKMLARRQHLLNEMFLCTPEEVADFEKVNDRLYDLTKKMYAKTASVYRAILTSGYDPAFDDDIMIEGTLRYVFNEATESVVMTDEEREHPYERNETYGSCFAEMLDIISGLDEDTRYPAFITCRVSYDKKHKPDMDDKDFGLDDFLDDGETWAEGPLAREEFKDICVCYATHVIGCDHDLYSVPDLLRLNDFWCEVTVTYQHLVDRDGNRYSCIEETKEDEKDAIPDTTA